MFDGTTRTVETIRPDDLLMGPDSRPRRVLSVSRGHGRIVEISPNKGPSWRCNEDHVLTLVRTGERDDTDRRKRNRDGEILDVSVKDWWKWSAYRKHVHKLFRVGVDFPDGPDLPLDPYILGVFLGDGDLTNRRCSVTTADPEIVSAAYKLAADYGLGVRVDDSGGTRTPTYFLTGGVRGKPNPVLDLLRRMGLAETRSGTKFVPDAYLTASKGRRLALLAGLLDTDGSHSAGCFDYLSKSAQLADAVAFLARSVGLAAYISSKIVFRRGVYWRVSISGHTDQIPTRIPRKQAAPRRSRKDALRTGFSVYAVENDDYFGFNLDGDGRYLLSDFTVTHNTVMAGHIMRALAERNGRSLVLAHRQEILSQFAATCRNFGVEDLGIIKPRWPEQPWQNHHLAMVQTLVRRLKKTRLKPTLIVIDECHHAAAATYKKILARFPNVHILGLSATPERPDGKGLDDIFQVIVQGESMRQLIKMGRLAPIEVFRIPTGISGKGKTIRANEYALDEQEIDLIQKRKIASVRRAVVEYCHGRRWIAFGPTRAASRKLEAELLALGIRCAHIDGTFKDWERRDLLERFADGRVDGLLTVDLISEGFDCPAADTVILYRATKSHVVYLQAVGRACRFEEEKVAWLLDCAGVSHEHGMPYRDRKWSLKGRDSAGPRSPSEDENLTVCPNCFLLQSSRRKNCLHCGFCFTTGSGGRQMPSELDVSLERVEGDPEIDALILTKDPTGGYSRPALNQALMNAWKSGGPSHVEALGRKLGYLPGWAEYQTQLLLRGQHEPK